MTLVLRLREAAEGPRPPMKLTAVCSTDARAVTVAAAARITTALTGASFLAVALNAAVGFKPTLDLQDDQQSQRAREVA